MGEGRDEGDRETFSSPIGMVAVCKDLACRWKTTLLAPGDENCRCQNHFGMDDAGEVPCKKQILADN
jgi:hypothetical protein